MLLGFISWWYGAGWRRIIHTFSNRSNNIEELFSMQLLSRTLFQPWRRIISYSGDSLSDRFRASLDNAISRAIGFVVRGFSLLLACLCLLLNGLFTIVEYIVWPLLPVAPIALIVIGIVS